MGRLGIRTGLVAIVVVLLAPPLALAERYTGKTSQGRPVTLFADDEGILERVTFRKWRTNNCRKHPGVSLHETTSFIQPMDVSKPGFFQDAAPPPYTIRDTDGFRIRIKGRVTGRQVSEDRWTGRFSAVGIVRANGRVFDRCRLRSLRWSANAEQ